MLTAFMAIKKGMTQTWDNQGRRLAVTELSARPMVVTRLKSVEKDGYQTVQLGFGEQKEKRMKKSLKGQLKKVTATMSPRRFFELIVKEPVTAEEGHLVSVNEVLAVGDVVAVTGMTKGRGFAGVIKRWGFAGGPKTHGQSDRHRAAGAIGQGTSPGRVHKGKKMAGHYGVEQKTVKNLMVVRMDEVNQRLWVSGPVPGSTNSWVKLTKLGKREFGGLWKEQKSDETGVKKSGVTKLGKETDDTNEKSTE